MRSRTMRSWYSGMQTAGQWTRAGRAKRIISISTGLWTTEDRHLGLDWTPKTFEIQQTEHTGSAESGAVLALEPCAAMFVLLTGLKQSAPHLPTARPG